MKSTTNKKATIGLVQMRMSAERDANLAYALEHARALAMRGAQIICLPELFLNPYFCQTKDSSLFDLAESIPGPATDDFALLASETKTVILLPLFEKSADGRYFNSIAVIGTTGKILGVYHKMHIPSLPPDLYAENFYFEKGDTGFIVIDTPYASIAPLICYDQWFPESARIAAANGAQILFYPTAIGWPTGPRLQAETLDRAEYEAWQVIQRGHAIANTVFVAAANRVGHEANLKFWGTSFVSNPYGTLIAKASTDKAEDLIVECDLSIIDQMRADWPFLDERRIKCEQAPSSDRKPVS
ncbi:carbon-nitrogen hydrolase [Candidatus Uhrbacteria bacterium]|nr:carbon-nitrogen hydrolase [Candidatus Uhrbacteria bacterium]